MYAVIQNGGKQYVVEEGKIVELEKISAEVGDKVFFDQVLLFKQDGKPVQLGRPYLEKFSVESEIVAHGKAKKILVSTFKRRKGFHKQSGHRQPYTRVKVIKLGVSDGT